MQIHFCPACGGKLPDNASVRFCPYCGENLAAISPMDTVVAAESPPAVVTAEVAWEPEGDITSYADVLRCCDQFIAMQQKNGADAAVIKQQASELLIRLKKRLPQRRLPAAAATAEKAPPLRAPSAASEAYYNVILKASGDKERLARRLSTVFQRGLMAIRMAVDMVPCMLIYKNRREDIKEAIAILEAEELPYVVIGEEQPLHVALDVVIPGFFGLDVELQRILHSVPPLLWAGETVKAVIPFASMELEEGALLATETSLYFFNRPDNKQPQDWIITPYKRLADVCLHAGALEFVYHKDRREDWLYSDDNVALERLYQYVQQQIHS